MKLWYKELQETLHQQELMCSMTFVWHRYINVYNINFVV